MLCTNCDRALIYAILYQAFYDAAYHPLGAIEEQAARFIQGNSKQDVWLFDYYCIILDIEPEWLRANMLKAVKRERKIGAIARADMV